MTAEPRTATTEARDAGAAARIVEVRRGVLKKNDLLAARLRRRYAEAGLAVVNVVSSPGAGKTTLLERTLRELRARGLKPAALVGDLATENDGSRLAATGAPARQITTGTVCHLDAEMVERALADWDLASFDVLFIENVGNLVCPASYDLGETARAVLFAVTEGEDKPLKYPTLYNTADVVVLTKQDLADAAGFRRDEALAAIARVRPGVPILETSARSGAGLEEWLRLLVDLAASPALAAPAAGSPDRAR